MSQKIKDIVSGIGIIGFCVLTYVVLLQLEIKRERTQEELEAARTVLGMDDLRTLKELQEACGKDCRAEVNFVPASE